MYYEKKFLIGDYVKGKRTFNGEVIEGKFNGLRLYNKLNPKSVVGVIDTDERCYDVSVDSIELIENKDKRIRKELIAWLERKQLIPTEIKNEWIAWLEKQGEKSIVWNEEDEHYKNGLIGLVEDSKAGLPINLRGKAADKCIYWLKSLKDRIHFNQKEWNEEDEKKIMWLIRLISTAGFRELDNDKMPCSRSELLEWLKSLKPNRWKPSEEQLEALKFAANDYCMGETKKNLESLYNNLKNL